MTKHRWLRALAFSVLGLCPHLHSQTLVSTQPPAYPLAAKAVGVDGPVVLKGTLSKQGKMQDVHVVSGAPELRQAAVDAVRTWTYTPARHLGRTVEVDMTVRVNFDMGTAEKKAAEQAKAQAESAKSTQPSTAQDNSHPETPGK